MNAVRVNNHRVIGPLSEKILGRMIHPHEKRYLVVIGRDSSIPYLSSYVGTLVKHTNGRTYLSYNTNTLKKFFISWNHLTSIYLAADCKPFYISVDSVLDAFSISAHANFIESRLMQDINQKLTIDNQCFQTIKDYALMRKVKKDIFCPTILCVSGLMLRKTTHYKTKEDLINIIYNGLKKRRVLPTNSPNNLELDRLSTIIRKILMVKMYKSTEALKSLSRMFSNIDSPILKEIERAL